MTTLNCTRIENGAKRPYHRHDCETCHLLGSLVTVRPNGSSTVADVYLHGDRDTGTLISRDGSEPGENASLSVELVRLIASGELGDSARAQMRAQVELLDAFYSNVRPARRYTPTSRDCELPFVIKRQGRVFHANQDYGGRYRCVTVVHFPYIGSLNCEETLHEWFPSTRCTHEHDCCGHYYAYRAKLTALSNGRWLVSQTFNQNV